MEATIENKWSWKTVRKEIKAFFIILACAYAIFGTIAQVFFI